VYVQKKEKKLQYLLTMYNKKQKRRKTPHAYVVAFDLSRFWNGSYRGGGFLPPLRRAAAGTFATAADTVYAAGRAVPSPTTLPSRLLLPLVEYSVSFILLMAWLVLFAAVTAVQRDDTHWHTDKRRR